MARTSPLAGFVLTACLLAAAGAYGREWTLHGRAGTDTDLSGAACGPDGRCLLVSDEKRRAWSFTLDESRPEEPRLAVGTAVELPPLDGGREADAEAAAFDRGRFYAIGSHGVGRRSEQFEASRYAVYRSLPDGRMEASGRLAAILAATPGIADAFCTPAKAAAHRCLTLAEGGANIEGLAVRDGWLHLGFRAPAPDGEAWVVRVAEAAVFGEAAAETTTFRLRLGRDERGRAFGIRDLAAVGDGFLILAGPALPEGDDQPGSGVVFHWRGGTDAPRRLGDVGRREKGVKPEVLLLLGEDAGGYRVLVLHDGIGGGAPIEYRLTR